MKYSYAWLKDLSGTKKTPAQIANMINMRAFELEETKKIGNDTQLNFNILPNRAHDTLSHVGLAREICAIDGKLLKSEKIINLSNFNDRQSLKHDGLQVAIRENYLCPRYIGAVIENIKVSASPKWLQQRLIVCGIKPINNIVDITNYIMLETGQPLHAFDIKKTTGNVIVRKARRDERIKLLDEKVYELNENNLLIADSEKPLALAGVMGGLDSSVSKKTKTIILESANFNATNIRKTRTALGIQTESSYRFEREIDPNLAEIGAARAIELLKKYGGKNVKVTALNDVYPKKIKPWAIKLDSNYVKSLLGEKIPVAKMKNILENLGINVKVAKNILNCEIPIRRIDLKTQEDLIEEIGRIYGYENIKEQAPTVKVKTPLQNAKRDFENKLRDVLTGLGFSEVMNYSFYGTEDIAKCNLKIEDHVEVANPMNPEQQYMRTTLIPGLIKNVKLNLKYFDKFSIFEIGHVYSKKEEKTILAGVLVNTKEKNQFFKLKGELRALFNKLNIPNTKYEILDTRYEFWNPVRTAEIKIGNISIGKIGELNPAIVKYRTAAFEIDVEKLLKMSAREKLYHPISKFPTVRRDISMFIPINITYAKIESEIKKSGGELVKGIELFDTFKNSLALRLKIGSDAKTLTSAEIDAAMKKIIAALEKKLKVKVRK